MYYRDKTATGYSGLKTPPKVIHIGNNSLYSYTEQDLIDCGWLDSVTRFPADALPALTADQKYGEPTLVGGRVVVAAIALTVAEVDDKKQALCDSIDTAAGAARCCKMSPGSEVVEEYQVAASEAAEWDAGGRVGIAPESVQSWADAKGWTAAVACADILAARDMLLTCLASIRRIRLIEREKVRNAATVAEAQTITTAAIAALDAL